MCTECTFPQIHHCVMIMVITLNNISTDPAFLGFEMILINVYYFVILE